MSAYAVTSFWRLWLFVHLRRTGSQPRPPGHPGVCALGFLRKNRASSCRWLIPPAVRFVVVVVV